jgi:hypothetical protein
MSNISVRNDVICMLENLIPFNCERWISTINTQHFGSNQAASSLSLPIDRCCTCAQRVFNTTLLCSFLSDFTLFASNVNAVRTRLCSHCPENSWAFVSALFCYPFCGSDKQHMDQYDHPLSTSTAPSDGISRCMFGLGKKMPWENGVAEGSTCHGSRWLCAQIQLRHNTCVYSCLHIECRLPTLSAKKISSIQLEIL